MGKFCYEFSALLTGGVGLSTSNRLTELGIGISAGLARASSVLVMRAAIREPTPSLIYARDTKPFPSVMDPDVISDIQRSAPPGHVYTQSN